MRTFKIEDGDLVVGPGGFQTITGAARVRQDLAVAVREPLGSDRFHPGWGSRLEQFIGSFGDELTLGLIRSEVYRLIRNYVALHGDQVRADIISRRKPRYSTNDMIQDVDGVQVRQDLDRLYVRVLVRTVSGETVTLTSTTGV